MSFAVFPVVKKVEDGTEQDDDKWQIFQDMRLVIGPEVRKGGGGQDAHGYRRVKEESFWRGFNPLTAVTVHPCQSPKAGLSGNKLQPASITLLFPL